MSTYSIKCPICGYKIDYMWQTDIKKINKDNNIQTVRFACPICDKYFEFKRLITFDQPFDIKEIGYVEEVDEKEE